MKLHRRVLPLLTLALLVFSIAPMSAAAASPASARAVNQAAATAASAAIVPVTGTIPGAAGTFSGALNITSFALQGSQVVANGTLNGTLTNAAGTVLATLTNEAVTLPVSVSSTCTILHLELGPLDLNLLGLVVHLNRVVLDITADPSGGLLGQLLCAIANLLNNGGPLSTLIGLLNQLFTLAPTAMQNIAAPGTGTTTGTFSGALTVTRFASQNGQLVAVGTLSGTLTNALGQVIGTITDSPVTVPLQATGTCTILHLVLGPLDLNLLGLMVHLDRVVLDITAQSGPGNLLGNLLCAIAHLLDGNSALAPIVNLLNHILALLR